MLCRVSISVSDEVKKVSYVNCGRYKLASRAAVLGG